MVRIASLGEINMRVTDYASAVLSEVIHNDDDIELIAKVITAARAYAHVAVGVGAWASPEAKEATVALQEAAVNAFCK